MAARSVARISEGATLSRKVGLRKAKLLQGQSSKAVVRSMAQMETIQPLIAGEVSVESERRRGGGGLSTVNSADERLTEIQRKERRHARVFDVARRRGRCINRQR